MRFSMQNRYFYPIQTCSIRTKYAFAAFYLHSL